MGFGTSLSSSACVIVEMASERNDTAIENNQNVLLRILNLPSISAALEPIEKTYISIKQSHRIVSSVCGLYEMGVIKAGSWAIWSMKPALHVLKPQLVAVNSMACRGLDHVEEMIPALHGPPAELAASIKELVSSSLEAAKDGIAGPIKRTSNTVLCKVSGGFQESKITISDSIQNILNSKAVCLAEQRVGGALTLTGNLIDYFLPASAEETEDDGRVRKQKPDAKSSGLTPSLSRLGAQASTIYRRALEKTAAQIQHATSQGQKLISRVPGVTPMVNYTRRSMKAVGSVLLRLPNSVLKAGQQHNVQEMTNESAGLQMLVTGLGQQFQKAYGSVVTNVKKAVAKDGVRVVLRSFGTARKRTLHNLLHELSKADGDSQPTERDEKDEAEKSLCGSMELQSKVADPTPSSPDDAEEQTLRGEEPMEESEEIQKEGHEADSYETESDSLASVPSHSPSENDQADPTQMPSLQSGNESS